MKINNMPAITASQTADPVKKLDELKREKDLEKACQGFEALWLNTLMKSMRDTLPGNTLFPESNASGIYQSLHDQHLTDNLSKGGSVTGFKEFLYQQLQDSI